MPAERILLVEDSATQVEATRAVLQEHGFEVEVARTGEDALERARQREFDLVLSDVVMPGMSGFQLCHAIKHLRQDPPPVVLLTSLADPRDIVRGVECGADNYITKPYEPQQLAGRIRHVLNNHRLRAQRPADGPVSISFLGQTYTIESDPAQILALLLSSFEELIRTNNELQQSKRQLAQAHERELRREQEARVQAEEDTRRMELLKQKAEAATRVRDEVLATVSHDLKNPLGTIFTSAALLLEMDMPRDALRRQLEIIRRTAERMDRLIADLLDVSRLEAGYFSVDARPEDAASLVLEARDQLGSMAQANGITLEVDVERGHAQVRADRNRVLQVFSNLIGNAIKFTPEGGSITVSAAEQDDHVRFAVTDTGVGIAPDDLPRIFERFWYGPEKGGSGLGLAIARGIVDAHGGSITAESEGQGSTFSFTLPLASVSSELSS
jgi:two-component system, sensor histidine kinase and response regulator